MSIVTEFSDTLSACAVQLQDPVNKQCVRSKDMLEISLTIAMQWKPFFNQKQTKIHYAKPSHAHKAKRGWERDRMT